MKYRNRTMGALVAVGALTLAACSSGDSDDTTAPTGAGGEADFSGETLKVMHYEGDESAMGKAWNLAIEMFEEQTGATVDLQTTAFEDLNASAEQLFDSSDAPDVSEYNKGNGTAGQLAAIGVIQNLDDAYAKYGWADKLGAGVDTIAKYNEDGVMGSGSFYGVPNYGEFVFMYYNTEMFEEYGIEVPTSQEDLEAAMQTFVDNGITPLTTSAQEYPMGQLWYQLALSQADRDFVNAYQLYTEEVNWQGEEISYATETLSDWVSNGYISSEVSGLTAEDAGLQFINGEVPMFYSGSWWYGRMLSDVTDFTVGITNWPGTTLTPGSGGNIWVIPVESKQPELAEIFIDITMSPEVQALLGESGGLPVAANTEDVQDPDAQALIGLFNEVNDRDGLSFYPDWPTPSFYGDLNGVMQGLVNGTFTPEQAQSELENYYESYVSTVR
ncbi:extracellular solute-binding protein [Demequina sp. TTPB684]|uniref:ABC transporter substrate-binding protein n=1 Tax=unclassified Demequina TaxID=2620311 RepID=UPI001CF4CB1B|nr:MULTISPECIES: extracellular solute-binding protein [unclassified Demequina]MCB2411914.1 extracellular solute-binding protein [Demequina sp. TTPB684]UPU87638.1 extracellular solute-binding protein [Demequina sp. TMPB413]